MIGYISEFAIDQHSGKVLGYELTTDLSIQASEDKKVIPFDKVITVGRDVLVVTDDVQESLAGGFDDLANVLGTEGLSFTPSAPVAPVAKPAAPPVQPKPAAQVPAPEPKPAPAPAPEPKPAPAPAPEPAPAEDGGENLSDIFEKRQINYMMGKKVSKDVADDSGNTIIAKGTVIDNSVIAAAKGANKFMELSMSIEIED